MHEISQNSQYFPPRTRNSTKHARNFGGEYISSLNGYLLNTSNEKRKTKAQRLNAQIKQQQLKMGVLQRRHQIKQLDEEKLELGSRIRKLKEQVRVNYRMALREKELHKNEPELGEYKSSEFSFLHPDEKLDTNLEVIMKDNDELIQKMSNLEK